MQAKKHNENSKYEKAKAAFSGGRETSLYRTAIVFLFFFFFLLMHLVYPSRSRWKSLCQINKQGTACSLSVGGKKWWQTLRSPSEPQVKSTAAQQFIYPARKRRCHLYLDV